MGPIGWVDRTWSRRTWQFALHSPCIHLLFHTTILLAKQALFHHNCNIHYKSAKSGLLPFCIRRNTARACWPWRWWCFCTSLPYHQPHQRIEPVNSVGYQQYQLIPQIMQLVQGNPLEEKDFPAITGKPMSQPISRGVLFFAVWLGGMICFLLVSPTAPRSPARWFSSNGHCSASATMVPTAAIHQSPGGLCAGGQQYVAAQAASQFPDQSGGFTVWWSKLLFHIYISTIV